MNLTQFRGLDTLVLSGGRRDWKCLKKQRFRCSQLDLWSPRHDIPDDFNEPLVESLSMLSLYETNESFQAPPVQEEPNCQIHKLTVTVNDPVTPWASDPASFTKYLDIKFVVSCRFLSSCRTEDVRTPGYKDSSLREAQEPQRAWVTHTRALVEDKKGIKQLVTACASVSNDVSCMRVQTLLGSDIEPVEPRNVYHHTLSASAVDFSKAVTISPQILTVTAALRDSDGCAACMLLVCLCGSFAPPLNSLPLCASPLPSNLRHNAGIGHQRKRRWLLGALRPSLSLWNSCLYLDKRCLVKVTCKWFSSIDRNREDSANSCAGFEGRIVSFI